MRRRKEEEERKKRGEEKETERKGEGGRGLMRTSKRGTKRNEMSSHNAPSLP